MEAFNSIIKEDQEVLDYLCEFNNITKYYNEVGFCARFEEYLRRMENPNDNTVQQYIDSGFMNLTPLELKSLYEFGYKINNSYSEDYLKRYEVHIINLEKDLDTLPQRLIGKLMAVKNMLDKSCVNIILIHVDNDVEFSCFQSYSIYSQTIFEIASQFKQANEGIAIEIYETDLTAECTGSIYKYRSSIASAFSLAKYMPIDSQDKLNILTTIMRNNSKVYLDTHQVDSVSEVDLMCIAYLALREKCVFLTDSGKWDTSFLMSVKTLFNSDWNSASFIEHISKLNDGMFILNNGSSNFLCSDVEVKDSYTISYIPVRYALSGTDDAIMRHIIKADKAVVSPEDFMQPSIVLQAMKSLVGGDNEKLIELISRIHMMSLYHLTDKLIGFCNISWVTFNNEICFCVVDDLLNDTTVNVYLESFPVRKTCKFKDLLPLSIFELQYFKSINPEEVLSGTTLDICTCEHHTYDFLESLVSSRNSLNFTRLCADDRFEDALLCIYDPKTSLTEDMYQLTIRTFGKEFVDKMAIGLNGYFQPNFKVSSLI